MTTERPERIIERLTLKHLEPYAQTVCWLRLKEEKHEYVGVYRGMDAIVGGVNLNLRQMVFIGRTRENGEPVRKLRTHGGEPQIFPFTIDECTIEKKRGTRSKIRTAQGDQIFLSREPRDVKRILTLIKNHKPEK